MNFARKQLEKYGWSEGKFFEKSFLFSIETNAF